MQQYVQHSESQTHLDVEGYFRCDLHLLARLIIEFKKEVFQHPSSLPLYLFLVLQLQPFLSLTEKLHPGHSTAWHYLQLCCDGYNMFLTLETKTKRNTEN